MQTQVWLNEELQKDFSQYQNLSEVISHLEESAWNHGEVICEVHVNDMYLNESDEKKFANAKLTEIQKLTVLSRTPEELMKESLASAVSWVPKFKKAAAEVANAIRGEGLEENTTRFVEVLDGCQWLSESMYLLKPMLFKIIEDDDFIRNWDKNELFFANVAKESLKAFETGDIVLLSDILEYDLTSSLDKWLQLLSSNERISKIIS